eukprot:3661749-Amphidinium_carterae.1
MQHAFEPDVADYACVVGVREIPDHLEVEAWPAIEVADITDVTLVGTEVGGQKWAMRNNGIALRWAPVALQDMEGI